MARTARTHATTAQIRVQPQPQAALSPGIPPRSADCGTSIGMFRLLPPMAASDTVPPEKVSISKLTVTIPSLQWKAESSNIGLKPKGAGQPSASPKKLWHITKLCVTVPSASLRLSLNLDGSRARLREQTSFFSPVRAPVPPAAAVCPPAPSSTWSISSSNPRKRKKPTPTTTNQSPTTHIPLSLPSDASKNIICGRGGESNNHEGNQTYRGLAKCLASEFERIEGKHAKHTKRIPYLKAMIEALASGGMRFIEMCYECEDGSFVPKTSMDAKYLNERRSRRASGPIWMQNTSRVFIQNKARQFFRDAINAKSKKVVTPSEEMFFCSLGVSNVLALAVSDLVSSSTKAIWLNALLASVDNAKAFVLRGGYVQDQEISKAAAVLRENPAPSLEVRTALLEGDPDLASAWMGQMTVANPVAAMEQLKPTMTNASKSGVVSPPVVNEDQLFTPPRHALLFEPAPPTKRRTLIDRRPAPIRGLEDLDAANVLATLHTPGRGQPQALISQDMISPTPSTLAGESHEGIVMGPFSPSSFVSPRAGGARRTGTPSMLASARNKFTFEGVVDEDEEARKLDEIDLDSFEVCM
ncbi:hypothetical protein TrVE_jg2589 [Triparma verrucosa]|uniref:DUF6824 domain-containing protein n=1 Tax=Triparma verrucosa TaxID=1606542 RepID=A0A9W7FHW0_9STRA|nr:hypothetical protein TrVE_jg2589 [Triparma verrucosa]